MKIRGFRFPKDIIMLSLRWYLRYGLYWQLIQHASSKREISPQMVFVLRYPRI
jgi:transposase-like protein